MKQNDVIKNVKRYIENAIKERAEKLSLYYA